MITISNLGIFGQVATAKGDGGRDTLQLSGDGTRLHVGDKYYSARFLKRLFRTGSNKLENNQIRTQLLENLARTFGLEVSRDAAGKCVFSAELMDQLERQLGKDIFKRGDFGLDEHGHVASGSPLTERRITAIVDRVHELHGTKNAESALKSQAGLFRAFLIQSRLELDDDKPLSPLDMARIVEEFNTQGGDEKLIHTVEQIKKIIERATGRTCHIAGVGADGDEQSLLEAHLMRSELLAQNFQTLQAEAKTLLAAHALGPRVSLRECVRIRCENFIEAVYENKFHEQVNFEPVSIPEPSLATITQLLSLPLKPSALVFLNEHAQDENTEQTVSLVAQLLQGKGEEAEQLLGSQFFMKDAYRGVSLAIEGVRQNSGTGDQQLSAEDIRALARKLVDFFTVDGKLQATSLYQFLVLANQNTLSALEIGVTYRRATDPDSPVLSANRTGVIPITTGGSKAAGTGFFFNLSRVNGTFSLSIRDYKRGAPAMVFCDKKLSSEMLANKPYNVLNVVREMVMDVRCEIEISNTPKGLKAKSGSASATFMPL